MKTPKFSVGLHGEGEGASNDQVVYGRRLAVRPAQSQARNDQILQMAERERRAHREKQDARQEEAVQNEAQGRSATGKVVVGFWKTFSSRIWNGHRVSSPSTLP